MLGKTLKRISKYQLKGVYVSMNGSSINHGLTKNVDRLQCSGCRIQNKVI